ncbi:phosphotransferase enzyme family protein [Ornithinimicrobium cryptoxanthini]|uniref:Phosphotransferase n=1 Tax=Ornithinimicrobium cryptoxanthini TaxID=2934161 RepID=A0ABY4YG77_9MICO|nr:phosphotransferase [Ornithinimicrobium cryptoxanthini]USQ75674.1 phosphotransferase [Ornithinimicrobium cryptoxanthini]
MTTSKIDLLEWAMAPDGVPSESMHRLAQQLLGHDVSGVEVIRRGSNLVLKDTAETTVFRVQHVCRSREVEENLQLVASLDSAGAPVVAARNERAAKDGSVVVTAWPKGLPAGTTDQRALGATLNALHDITPPAALPTVDVRARFEERLTGLDADVPVDIVTALSKHADLAVTALEESLASGSVLLHGDAHIGNLVWLRDSARFIDLDDLCTGPREFDLAPSLVSYHRFHRDDRLWSDFRAGYGDDPDWELAERLTVVREATMNTWLATLWAYDSAAQTELLHRIDTWDTDWKDHDPWRPI